MSKKELVEIKRNQTGHGLLIEHDGYISIDNTKIQQIKESIGSHDGDWFCPNPFIVDAVFQKYDIENANGRIYPEAVLKREVEKYQVRIRERRALGECNHPSDSVIDLGRISHNIIELHWEGRTLVGKIELNLSQGYVRHGICSTLGDTVANLLLNGYKIGVSSRGVGSVENKYGKMIVGDDFEIICWDVVCDPSTPNAYIGKKEELQQYVETKEHMEDVITEKINKIKKILD